MVAVRLPAPERRRQLLDVALASFADQGFHATSMNDLADAAGVTKPVLYQHFPSKHELYVEILDDVTARLEATIRHAVDAADDERSRLVAGLRAYFNFVDDERDAFVLVFGGGAPRDDDVVRNVRRTEARIAATIADLLGPDVDPVRAGYAAAGILGLAQGTIRHWSHQHDGMDVDTLAELTADLLSGGLQTLR